MTKNNSKIGKKVYKWNAFNESFHSATIKSETSKQYRLEFSKGSVSGRNAHAMKSGLIMKHNINKDEAMFTKKDAISFAISRLEKMKAKL